MLGPKQGMGRRFLVLAHSNYPLCKKTSGRWMNFLKPHNEFPQTFFFRNMDKFTTSL
jgi:hypothetical protein